MATVINPLSKRSIKVGGAVYNGLVASGVIKAATLQPTDASTSKDQQTTNNESVGSNKTKTSFASHLSSSTTPLLPAELLKNELFLHLDARSILSFCASDRANNAICVAEGVIPSPRNDASSFWLNRFALSLYEERREDFLTLTTRPEFSDVLVEIIKQKDGWIDSALIDDYHVRLVIAGRDKEANRIKEILKEHPIYYDSLILNYFSMNDIPGIANVLKIKHTLSQKNHDKIPQISSSAYEDARLYPIGDALRSQFDESDLPDVISRAMGRENRYINNWGAILFISLVRANRDQLVKETLEKIKNRGIRIAMTDVAKKVSTYRPAFTHPIYRYTPRERAYYWGIVDDFEVQNDDEFNFGDYASERINDIARDGYEAYAKEMNRWYLIYAKEFAYRITERRDEDLHYGYTTLDPELDWVMEEKDIKTI